MHTSDEIPPDYWPVYKGKSFDIWDPGTNDAQRINGWAKPKPVQQWLQQRRENAYGNRNSAHSEFTREHIFDPCTLPPLHNRLAFRGVASSTNRRTIICALIPRNVFLVNSAPYLLFPRGDELDQTYLLGMLCSLCVDWCARRVVGSSINHFILNALPIPRPGNDDVLRQRVIALAGRLACPDDRFADWAKAIGTCCGELKPKEKQKLICELDAIVAHLFGLSHDQLEHIFRTFHKNWAHEQRMADTLAHYACWASKLQIEK